MSDLSHQPAARKIEDARDLQARLYREIGISAVAAALRYAGQAGLNKPAPTQRDTPAILRDEHKAA